jgi:hypothetical protein
MSAPRGSTKRSPIDERFAQLVPNPSDQELDEALALTFPASDPPAQTQPIVHVGTKTTNGPQRSHPQR